MSDTAYTYLHTDKLRMEDLPAVIAHDSRAVEVPNAMVTKPDGWVLLQCNGDDPMDAFHRRRMAAGVELPHASRYVAMEVLLTLSPEHDQEPSDDVFFARAKKFMADMWGPNFLCLWGHRDEKTQHAQGLVALLCDGARPGRPKRGEKPVKPGLVYSWNIFSGSRDRRFEKGQVEPRQTENPTFSRWQSEWSFIWIDHGYRRGFPSSRDPVRPRWIHGKTAAIGAAADLSLEGIHRALEGFQLPAEALTNKSPEEASKAIQSHLKSGLLPQFKTLLGYLTELASRGIQLPMEKASRADLGKQNEAFRRQLEEMRSGHAVLRLEAENARLQAESEGLRQAVAEAKILRGGDVVANLDDKDLQALISAELQRRAAANHGDLPVTGGGPTAVPVAAEPDAELQPKEDEEELAATIRPPLPTPVIPEVNVMAEAIGEEPPAMVRPPPPMPGAGLNSSTIGPAM